MKSVVSRCVIGMLATFSTWCAMADDGYWNESDSMLYWMIDDSNQIEFQYAVVYAVQTANIEGKLWNTDVGYGDVGAIALPKDLGGFEYETKEGSHTATLDILTELGSENWSSYSFYIELLQWDDVNGKEIKKGVSYTSSYDDLVSNNHVLGSGMTIPSNLVVWAPQTGTVPEPSSWMLVLLGGALLSLRRRNDVV